MYSLYLETSFIASAKKLDKKVKEELDKNLKLLESNPYHPHLHLKPLHGPLKEFHSFRIREHRVIMQFLKDRKIRVLDIEKRDKVYR